MSNNLELSQVAAAQNRRARGDVQGRWSSVTNSPHEPGSGAPLAGTVRCERAARRKAGAVILKSRDPQQMKHKRSAGDVISKHSLPKFTRLRLMEAVLGESARAPQSSGLLG